MKRTASCCGNRTPSCANLAAKYKSTTLEPADLRMRAHATKWMDWQLAVAGPAIFDVFWGLIRTAAGKAQSRRNRGIEKENHAAMDMLDRQLERTKYLAGDGFSYGDIRWASSPIVIASWCRTGPPLPNFERWYARFPNAKRSRITLRRCPSPRGCLSARSRECGDSALHARLDFRLRGE